MALGKYTCRVRINIYMNNNTIRVGIVSDGYKERRNFIDLPYSNVQFIKKYDIFKITNHVLYKLNINKSFKYASLYSGIAHKKVDLMHMFFGLSMARKPWIVTTSSHFPRWNPRSRFGIKLLASDPCKKIIAISKNSYDVMMSNFWDYPEYADRIAEKSLILHPPQRPNITGFDNKSAAQENKTVHFAIIGHLFYVKGGREILKACDRLIGEGYEFHLTIVSLLEPDRYAANPNDKEIEVVENLIAKHEKYITYIHKLSNEKVIDILKNAHVSLLPSYAETYGYSVLEAQSCGCPVITTDIRALPEINNEEVGWVINVPKDEYGRGIYKTDEQRKEFSEILHEGIYQKMKYILDNPDQIPVKGQRALERIKREHDPEKNARIIEGLYNSILENKLQI